MQRFHPCRQAAQTGFTLIELAIVLAIVGLLVGGILATQSYIRSSEITTLYNQGRFYLNQLKQFETVYGGALPGDMGNATEIWSNAAYNGNGNGNISDGLTVYPEIYAAFNHLQLAGLIVGSYTGVQGPAGVRDGKAGVNLPNLGITNVSGYFQSIAVNETYVQAMPSFFSGYYGTAAFLIGENTTGNNLPSTNFLTSAEAFEADSKYDNGLPTTGTVRTYKPQVGGTAPDCVVSEAYNLANTNDDICRPILTSE